MISPPVIINEADGSLGIFRSVEAAEQHLEPIDVENDEYTAYDSTGRRLKLCVRSRPRRILFGLCRVQIKEVYVEMPAEESNVSAELQIVLARALQKAGMDTATVRGASLEELVAEAEIRLTIARLEREVGGRVIQLGALAHRADLAAEQAAHERLRCRAVGGAPSSRQPV